MLANYHTHTERCYHASGEDKEYVEAAIKAGLKVLGFSDHCPWIFEDDFISGMRMHPSEVDAYFSSLEALKKEYQKDIKLYIGFEAEYIRELIEAQDDFFENYPLDYLILGQHFLGPEYKAPYMGMPVNQEEILKEYVDSIIEGIESGRYLYLAHPDLIYFTGKPEIYDKHMTRLCKKMKQMEILLEFNILGMNDHRNYPSKRFLEIAKKVGNSYILGIDAHAPEQILDQKAIRQAEKICNSYGIKYIDGLNLLG